MKQFIGYFDRMGYKQFIMNNTTDEARRRLGHVLRDIENSLAQEKLLLLKDANELIEVNILEDPTYYIAADKTN